MQSSHSKAASLMALGGALVVALAAAPALAETTGGPPVVVTDDVNNKAGTKATGNFVWGGIGLYRVGITVDFGGGSVSGSSTGFGFNVGGAINLVPITPDLQLAGWANAAIAFPSINVYPLTAGLAVRYDKLPVQLLGGLGFTIMPNGGNDTPLGLDIMVMGLYPLPMVAPRFSAEAQMSYNILSSGYSLFTFTVGAGYGF